MTDFPTSNSRRKGRKPKGFAGPVFGGIAVFLWAFVFSLSQSFTRVTGTANMPVDLALGIGAGLAGGLVGACLVWAFLYFVLGRRHTSGGVVLLAVMAGVALVGAVPASGFRVVGAGMMAEQKAMDDIRQRAETRRNAVDDRIWDAHAAIVQRDFFEPRALSERGGLARARGKVQALRELMAGAKAEDEQLMAQARAEIRELPISQARREQALRAFEAGVANEQKAAEVSLELNDMIFDEMDGQLDVLERRRWVMEYGQIAFTNLSDMNDFNARARRVQEISAELNRQASPQARR
ncbi:hypothetical protein [Brevundimonas sp. FT23028]|uniref:hypothetical protein n=1 Tax=Brevundimonas sp. FT23028 TaxID=3393748 RepID=UPI003B5874B1